MSDKLFIPTLSELNRCLFRLRYCGNTYIPFDFSPQLYTNYYIYLDFVP